MFNIKKYIYINNLLKNKSKNTKIIAISKNQSLDDIKNAISQGVSIFGENRVQEAKFKFQKLLAENNNIELHLTGPLQTNKVKDALKIFDVFHTLDREKLLKEFAKHPDIIKNKSFFIQVNTGKEETKSGVFPENVKNFYKLCEFYKVRNVIGLMCIPPINDSPKKHFKILKEISKEINLDKLSIGMSSDYEKALDFNPTYIRLGTILFGKRNWKNYLFGQVLLMIQLLKIF